MASKTLFQTVPGARLPQADARNSEGASAYAFPPKHQLAQYAATGCLSHTFYASGEAQLDTVLKLAEATSPEFVAKTAVFSRERGYMKDMPALLCAVLASRQKGELLERIFPRVIDNGRMLRNFVQIVRSGRTGRKSLGSQPRRLVREWLTARRDEDLFADSVGTSPSIADIIKMVHPRPDSDRRAALYAYLIDRPYNAAKLPKLVRAYEAFKMEESRELPEVPFQMLTSMDLSTEHWCEIARKARWHMTRMNLNTFLRHGVLKSGKMVRLIAQRLEDKEAIRKAKVFPYQLLAAYANAHREMPDAIRTALRAAMEIATANVPRIDGKVYLLPDVSGSMSWPVTGWQTRGATSKVRCVDVAGLIASVFLRHNRSAEVLPFDYQVYPAALNPRATVMANAQKLASLGGGGTNCSLPLAELNKRRATGDLVIFISDNESWMDHRGSGATATMNEWTRFKQRNPHARLVCLDIVPNATTQATERKDILNIGGFSDHVFSVIAAFAKGELEPGHWVAEIEKEQI